MTKCPKCGDSVKKTKIDYDIDEEKITVHDVPALKCSSCDYITMSTEQAEHFYNILERLHGSKKSLSLHRTLSSDGKSLILRIPKDIATTLNLSSKDEVEIWVDGQRVIVEKASA
jgi:YgiT-type zinc finger domain-containing protein